MSPLARLRRLHRHLGLSPSAWVGLAIVLVFLAAAAFGPHVAPLHPLDSDVDDRLLPASPHHLLGTDDDGMDVFSALLYGARMALFISGVSVLLCATIGVAIGIAAGYFRGVLDEIVMRIVDVLLAFPGLLLNLAIVAVVERPGPDILIFALTVNGWVGYARVARGQVLSLREREYVIAAQAIGARPLRIMFRHILPNLMSPLLVQATFGFGGLILVESSLSFLGLGPQVPYSWGSMLEKGTTWLWTTSRLIMVPGMAIALVVVGFNLLGDGLRDRFDPKRQR
jgi:peptide/nickel transport system permease protein